MSIAACAPQSPTGQFPIIGSDPDGLVETMDWVVPDDIPIAPDSFEEPLILENSTPTDLRIALKGGGCPPTVQAAISGDRDGLMIELNLGGAIQPVGVECPEILTTHILGIRPRQPVDLEALSVTAVRATDPISEG